MNTPLRRWPIAALLPLAALLITCSEVTAQIIPADETARVEAMPVAAAPGIGVTIIGLDLQPARSYDVLLVPRSGSASDLGNATADARGDFRFAASVPSGMAAGAYEIRIVELTGFPRSIRARTEFDVLAPLGMLPLTGLAPRPGKRVAALVSGLVPGTLELKYAGQTISGPVAVANPSHNLGFIIPADRPTSLPATVSLVAINRVGRLTVNTSTRNLNILPRSLTPLQIGSTTPPPPLRPSELVALPGRLTREDGIQADAHTTVDAYWFGANGSVIPLPGNATSFDDQGNYTLGSAAPGLLSMSADRALGSGEVRHFAREESSYAEDDDVDYRFASTGHSVSGRRAQRAQAGLASDPSSQAVVQDDGTLTVIVRNTAGQRIANAVVELGPSPQNAFTERFLDNVSQSPTKGADPEARSANRGRSARSAALFGTSQFSMVSGEMAEAIGVGPAPFVTPDCPATLKRQVTDSQGRAQFELDLDVLAELTAQFENCDPFNNGTDVICTAGKSIALELTVYGGQVGFGHRDPSTEAYLPASYTIVYLTDREYANDVWDGAYFTFQEVRSEFGGNGTDMHSLTPTFNIVLPPLNVPAVVVENVYMNGLPRESQPPTGGDIPPGGNGAAWFAPKVTIPLVTGTFASQNPVYSLFFRHSPLVGGTLTDTSFWFDTDNNGSLNRVGNFVFNSNQRGQCGLTNLDTYELPFGAMTGLGSVFRYGALNEGGERTQKCGEIRATNQSGATSKRQVCFQFAPLLNLELFNGATTNLVYNDDSPGFLTYGATLAKAEFPSGARNLSVPPVDNGDGEGGLVQPDQQNRVDNTLSVGGYFQSIGGSFTDTYQFNDTEQANYRGLQASTIVTRSSANVQASNPGATQTATQSLNSATTTTGSIDPVTVLDVGFPLFYYVWGLSPIAGLEMGADLTLLAQMVTLTKMSHATNEDGLPTIDLSEVLIRQLVDIGIDFYADLDVLFDLVDAEINLRPILCAGVQVQYPASPKVKELARVKLVFEYLFSVWSPPPFPNIEFEGDSTLASEGDAECQTINKVASTPGSAQKGAEIVAARPSRYSVAQAVDFTYIQQQVDTSLVGFTAYTEGFPATSPDFGKLKLLVKRPSQSNPIEIVRAYGVRNVDIEYYAPNRAVVVWVQSALPPPAGRLNSLNAVAARVAQQHIRYARWNGTSWSAPTNLTAPGTGEGGLSLAACHDFAADCDSGKILAVWTRSTSGNFRDLRTRVFRSEFTPAAGGTWTAPTSVDSGGVNDSHATAAYRNGQAVVAWLRNAGGSVASAKTRGLAYRVLDGSSPVRIASGVPAGLSSPKLAVDDDNRVAIAFTAPEDARAFLGNRNAVHVGEVGCSSGTCSFNVVKVKDRRGRSIYADKPQPVWGLDGTVFVGYRGVNYGVDSAGTRRNYAEDPIGIRFKSGEAMLFTTNLSAAQVQPVALTTDGGGYSAVDIAYDSTTGVISAATVRTPAIAANAMARTHKLGIEPDQVAASASVQLISNDVVVATRALGADLAITDIVTSTDPIVPGGSRIVDVTVINRGTPYVPGAAAPASVRADWDNPAATTVPAATVALAPLASGATRTIRMTVPMPSAFSNDEQHVLFIRTVGGSDFEDVDASNDQRSIALGGMPTPLEVVSATQPNLPMVRLEWTGSADPRVKGYRIYRQDGTGPVIPLGSSRVAAFVDISAQFGQTRTYFVSTYSQRGIESPLSEGIPVKTEQLPGGLFKDGFESE